MVQYVQVGSSGWAGRERETEGSLLSEDERAADGDGTDSRGEKPRQRGGDRVP